MTLTRNAIGNLINRYKAVLQKCNLMNTFGSLAVAAMLVLGGAGAAMAADTGIKWGSDNWVTDGWTQTDPSTKEYQTGSYADTGVATGGNVTIDTGGDNKTIYGGFANAGNATGNTVKISGGTVSDVYGGYARNGSNGDATGNTVIYSGGEIKGSLAGGRPDPGKERSGNTLLVIGKDRKVGNTVSGFQEYEFEIQADFSPADNILLEVNYFDFIGGADITRISIAGNRNIDEPLSWVPVRRLGASMFKMCRALARHSLCWKRIKLTAH